MFSALLALTLAQGINIAPSRLDQLQQAIMPVAKGVHMVVLDCRVAGKDLIDCRSAGKPLDDDMMARALQMTAGIVVPKALADAGDGRVRVKMNLAP